MKLPYLLIVVATLFAILGLASRAFAQGIVTVEMEGVACMDPSVCLPPEDMDVFVKLLREKKCMQETKPEFKLDQVQLFLDRDGRVFYNGAMPHPYKVHVSWCNYEIDATGTLNVFAAVQEPPIWGFRFRPKAYMGFVLAEPFYAVAKGEPSPDLGDVVDAGLMVDFLHYDFVNLNVALGFQSFGAAVGFDVTKNFGLYGGYGVTWGEWHQSPTAGLWFGF